MEELIERLENATGPDRELDRQIALKAGHLHLDRHGKLYRVNANGSRGYGGLSDDTLIRDYTASIDAALTLAEGELFTLSKCLQPDMGGKQYRAIIGRGSHRGAGITPAIALCIAALRARSVAEPAATKKEADNG